MLNKRINKEQNSEQSDSFESIKEKFAAQKENVVNTEVNKEDRVVRLVAKMDQFCGCGGKDDVEVNRTVPWDSPLQDGDHVEGLDESDEILGYVN